MFIFSILNGYVFYPEILALTGFRTLHRYSRDSDLLIVPFYKTNIGTQSFLNRALQ